jgi:anti-anti-sigma factor
MATLDCQNMNDLIVLKLKGALTSEELFQVEKPFEQATSRPGVRAVVDLTGVDIVTTPALSMFIAAANHAKNSGGKIVFTQATPPVRDILRRLRLTQVLTTVPGLDDAIAAAKV